MGPDSDRATPVSLRARIRDWRGAIGAAAALVVAASGLIASTPGASPATLGPVQASADAYVLSSDPNAKRGGDTVLRVRTTLKVAYVRFDVPALPSGETVTSAVLRLRARSGTGCAQGVEVLRSAGDTWGEKTITWRNQPGPTGSSLDAASWSTTGWQDFDVTSAVTRAGPVSFVLRHASGCAAGSDVIFSSRESGSGPQLVVETARGTAPTATQPPAESFVAAAAGDIACDPGSSAFDGSNPLLCQHRGTAALLAGADVVLPLGDLQYPSGELNKFLQAYDPSWGQHAPRTYPSVGNHEYGTPEAQGYFDYWAAEGRPTGGPSRGYYSFDVGAWHLVSLNSNCSIVACAEGTPQNDFLEADLAATTRRCILAYWHTPYFNSGSGHGGHAPAGVKAFLEDLYAARADLVLNGHDHNYQRYAKQTPSGVAAANGFREFVVGTGGKSHYGLLEQKDANYEFGLTGRFGVLKLHLGETAYSWQFVSTAGQVLDSGGPVACN
jgi:hypothetical protein